MKIERPSEIVEVCDLCQRQKIYLKKCIVCGKDYCLLCESVIPGCMHQPGICKDCGGDQYVKDVVLKYSKDILNIVNRRDQELKNWGIVNENAKDKTK